MYHLKLLQEVLKDNYDNGFEINPLLRDKIENYLTAHEQGQILHLDNVSVSDLEFKAALTLIRDLINLKDVVVICKKDWNEVIESSIDFLNQHSR